MGADLLIMSIGLTAKKRYEVDEESAKSAFAKAREAIAAIDDKTLAAINTEPGIPYADVESCKRTLLDDLADVEAAALGSHRQAAIVEGGGGIVLLLSGGLSWGDSPSELFESMSRLLEADVFPDARWPEPA
jgi:hypothetical protein